MEEELEFGAAKAGSASPGVYEISKIFGSRWRRVRQKTRCGIAFRQKVARGEIPGVRVGPKTAQNHQTYIVGGGE